MASVTPAPSSASRKPANGGSGSAGGSAGRRIPNAAASPASADQRFSASAFPSSPQIDGRTPQPEGQKNTIRLSPGTAQNGNIPKQQARTLGNLIGSQQAEARMNSLNQSGEGRSESDSKYPPSVLDAMRPNAGIPPTESMYADNDETSDSEETEQKAAFQQEQLAGAEQQAHFLQRGEGYDEDDTEFDYDPALWEDNQGMPESNYQSIDVYQSTPDTALRLGALLQAEDEADDEEQATNTQQLVPNKTTAANEMYEMAQRGRRLFTASTGIGFLLALGEIDLIAINRGLFKGSIQTLPGARPDGAYEENPDLRKSDWIDIGLALTIHAAGFIMILGALVQLIILVLPFIVPALGLAYATQLLGPDVANLLMSWAPTH